MDDKAIAYRTASHWKLFKGGDIHCLDLPYLLLRLNPVEYVWDILAGNAWAELLPSPQRFGNWNWSCNGVRIPKGCSSVRPQIYLNNFKPMGVECIHIFKLSHLEINIFNYFSLYILLKEYRTTDELSCFYIEEFLLKQKT